MRKMAQIRHILKEKEKTQLPDRYDKFQEDFGFFFFPTFILVHSQIWLIYFSDYSMRESL